MHPDDPRWKAAYDPGPDPHTYKALLSEFKMGYQRSQDEASAGSFAPASAAMNLETGDLVVGAEEVMILMKRIVQAAQGPGVSVQPERLVAKLSSGLSKMIYNLGRVQGYRDASR